MLHTCFRHLPGVGPAFETKLAAQGIATWDDALTRPLPCGAARAQELRALIGQSQERLAAGDAAWFGTRLPAAEQWLLFPHFKHSAAYVDIETNGLYGDYAYITAIALYDGEQVRSYARGGSHRAAEREIYDLEVFAQDITAYKLLVTWNGRCFDAPMLRRELGIALDKEDRHGNIHMAHLDLRPVFRV